MSLLRTPHLAVIIAAALAWTSSAIAQDAAPPPSADEIKRVYDYLDNGKDRGPALLDLVACMKVDQTKGSPTQFHCLEPVTAPVKKNTTVLAWVQFLCPKDGKYEDVSIQYLHEGQVRNTYDLTLSAYGKTRTWKGSTLTKAGKWTVKVLRSGQELGSTTVVVEN